MPSEDYNLLGCDLVWFNFTDVSEECTASILGSQSKTSKQNPSSMLGLIFDPEDGGSIFLRSVGKVVPDKMA
jgi:hypothetical protein